MKTVRSVVDLFFELACDGYTPRALKERQRIMRRFCAAYGDKPVSECDGLDLLRFLKNPAWKSDWTKRSVVSDVHHVFNWALKHGVIARNPFQGITVPEGEPRRPMTEEEFDRLCEYTNVNFRRLLQFLRYTGCRPGEAAALCWPMVSFERGIAVLPNHKTRKRTRKPRVIPLTAAALELLRKIHVEHSTGHVFLTNSGTPWNRSNMSLRMRTLREKAGVAKDAMPGMIRHLYATQAVLRGVNLKLVAQTLGHSQQATCERYYVALAGEIEALRAAAEQATGK